MRNRSFRFQFNTLGRKSWMQNYALVVCALLLGALIVCVAGLGTKPVHAAAPAPPPPVKFQLTLVAVPSGAGMRDMNNLGTQVGVRTDSTGIRHAILVENGLVQDLETMVLPPAGWYFASAYSINDYGSIVGDLGKIGTSIDAVRRGYVIHRPQDSPAYYSTIPDELWSFSFGWRINDDGLVLGMYRKLDGTMGNYVYDSQDPLQTSPQILPIVSDTNLSLNNSLMGRNAQVIGYRNSDGKALRYTLGSSSVEALALGTGSSSPTSINDFGDFCGSAAILTKRGTPSGQYVAYRDDLFGYKTFSATGGGAVDINSSGDLAISVSSGTQIYLEGYGVLKVNDLLLGTATDLSLFRNGIANCKNITERGSLNPAQPNYPGIGGNVSANGITYAFVLKPAAP